MIRPRLPRERVVEAYLLACRVAASAPPTIHRGYRVFYARPPRVSWVDLAPGDHGILGTHDKCDLVLPQEPDMRTRHSLAACSLLEDGTVALRLLDLHTDLPMFLHDDEAHVSLVVVGDFAVRLGHGIVGALSLEPSYARVASSMLSEPELDLHRSDRVPTARPADLRRSHITSLPPVSPIGTMSGARSLDVAGKARPMTAISVADRRPAYGLTLTRGRKAASVQVPKQVLHLGLVIGRADNCEDGGLRAVLDGTISRAHLLLLEEGQDVVAIDLCSLNGTSMNGVTKRRFVLPDSGATLHLGPQFELRWKALGTRH